jgi:hypothetical protein
MEITIAAALEYAPKVWALMTKLYGIIVSGIPESIDEEIAALEEARPRPADEIIAEADEKSAQ